MATRFFMRNLPAPQVPTANSKSTTLPVGTFNVTAGTTGNERLTALLTAGAGEVNVGIASGALVTQQSDYLVRFSSLPLAAQTINANTWTVAVAALESDANANSFLAVSLYVWRPATNAVVGFIYNLATALGSEWPTTKAGVVVTITGSALAVQTGDLLVLEWWHLATQATATAFTNTIYFNGTTAPVNGSAVTSAASYFETPQNLSFQQFAPLGVRLAALPIKERDDG